MKSYLKYILLLGFLFPNVSSAAITYATWNPADKNSTITLSGGNLIATQDATAGFHSLRSTTGVTSGKWYWEITPNVTSGSGVVNQLIGVANATAGLGTYLGADAAGWTYYGNSGVKINNSAQTAYAATYNLGDIISVALDMDAGTLTYYKNCGSLGVAFSGITGTIYAGLTVADSATQATANFGASAFSCSVPSGYNAGLYTGSAPVGGGFNFWQFMNF